MTAKKSAMFSPYARRQLTTRGHGHCSSENADKLPARPTVQRQDFQGLPPFRGSQGARPSGLRPLCGVLASAPRTPPRPAADSPDVLQNKAHPNAQWRKTNRDNLAIQTASNKRLRTRATALLSRSIAQNPKFNYFSLKSSAKSANPELRTPNYEP